MARSKKKNDFPYPVKGKWHKLPVALLRDPDLRSVSDLAYRVYFEFLSEWDPMNPNKEEPDEVEIAIEEICSRIPAVRQGRNPGPTASHTNQKRGRRQIQNAIKELILIGAIAKKRRKGHRAPNTYEISRYFITRVR